MRMIKRVTLLILFLATVAGCRTSAHQRYYTHVAPHNYAPTEQVRVFEYPAINLSTLYEAVFSDLLMIGKSGFVGAYQRPDADFARSIGADIVICSTRLEGQDLVHSAMTIPHIQTHTFSVFSGYQTAYGTITSYGTTTVPVTTRVNRYRVEAYFLKNVNNVRMPWEQTRADYPQSGEEELDGTWSGRNCRLDVYTSGQFVVGVMKLAEERYFPPWRWHYDDVMFVFDRDSRKGIYLSEKKQPMPSEFEINKFGHLVVKPFPSYEALISFERE